MYDSLLHVGKARPNWPGTRRKSSHWIDEDRPAWTKPCAVEPRNTPAVSVGPDSPSRTALRPLFLSSRPQLQREQRLASKKAVPRHASCGFKINSLSNELHHLPTVIPLLFERDDVVASILRPWPHGLKLHGLKVGLGVPLQHVLPLALHLHDVQHGEPAFLRVPVQLPQEFL